MLRCLAVFALGLLPVLLLAGPLEEKGPPYFVDRYGPAQRTGTVDRVSFLTQGRGGITLSGEFSVRTYRKDELRTEVVFFLPSLKPVAVRLWLKHTWTDEQVRAALQAYGGEWKDVSRNGVVKTWQAPDGSLAFLVLNSLQIQSKVIADRIEKELAEMDAKRKAVPKF